MSLAVSPRLKIRLICLSLIPSKFMVHGLSFLPYQINYQQSEKSVNCSKTLVFLPPYLLAFIFLSSHGSLIFERPNRGCHLYCNLLGAFQRYRTSGFPPQTYRIRIYISTRSQMPLGHGSILICFVVNEAIQAQG